MAASLRHLGFAVCFCLPAPCRVFAERFKDSELFPRGWLGFQRWALCFHSNMYFSRPGEPLSPWVEDTLYIFQMHVLSHGCFLFFLPEELVLLLNLQSVPPVPPLWTRSGRFKHFQVKGNGGLIVLFKQISAFLWIFPRTHVRRVSLWLMVWINSEDTLQPLQWALRLSDVAT